MAFSGDVLAHKIIATIIWIGGVASLLAGTVLVTKFRDSVVIRSRGYSSIMVTSAFLAIWMVIQVTRIWELEASCFALFLFVQLVIAVLSCIVFYRTYCIMHKLAMQQKAQQLMMIIAKAKNNEDVEEVVAEAQDSMVDTCCLRHIDLLRDRYRILYTALQFAVIMVAFFANPNSYEFESNLNCNADSSLYAGVILIVLYIVVALGFQFLEVSDSFHMIEELTYCAFGIILTFVLFAIIAIIDSTTNLSDQTVRDLQVDVAVVQQFIVAFSIVLMPGIWAIEREDEDADQRLKPDLVRVLAHEESLQLFKNHLIKEWSVENLLFYQDVTAIQILRRERGAERTLIKIRELYEKYISSEAPFEVNLSGPIAQPIHKFFREEVVVNALDLYRRGGMYTRRKKSQSVRDFLDIVNRVGKNGPDQKDEKEKQKKSRLQLFSLADDCVKYLARAKKEVFKLLNNDSYKRFCALDEVQKHFREHRALLLNDPIKKKKNEEKIDDDKKTSSGRMKAHSITIANGTQKTRTRTGTL